MFVDEKKTQRIVSVKTETEAAAPLIEIGEQPAFAMKVADVVERRRELGVVAGRARRDAFLDKGVDPVNEALLILSETEVQG